MFIREFPNKESRRWPAIKFAVSRTQRVIGRITFLVSSIITMNDMRARGVPCGRRWDSMWLVFLVHPNNTIVNQIRSDRGRVIMSWEVNEKIWGYRAVMFISKIKMNIVKIIGICLLSVFFRVNKISLNRIEMVLFFD